MCSFSQNEPSMKISSCVDIYPVLSFNDTTLITYVTCVTWYHYGCACIQCSKSPKDLLEKRKCFRQWHSGIAESEGDTACHFLTVNTSEVAFTDIEYVWSVIQWCLLNTLSATLTQQCAAQSKARGNFLTVTRSAKCVTRGRYDVMELQFLTYPTLQMVGLILLAIPIS